MEEAEEGTERMGKETDRAEEGERGVNWSREGDTGSRRWDREGSMRDHGEQRTTNTDQGELRSKQ